MKKFKAFVEFASKGLTKYDSIILFVSFVLVALSNDLKLETLYSVCGSIFMAVLFWYLCTFVCEIIIAIVEKVQKKKSNIETLIDEESKKDN